MTQLIPTVGEPFVQIIDGDNVFQFQACEAFGINGQAYHQTQDGQHYAGTGHWEIGDGVLIHKRVINTFPQMKYEVMIGVLDGVLEIDFTIRNLSGTPWYWPSRADMCFQHAGAAEFFDGTGARTYVPQNGMMNPMLASGDPWQAENPTQHWIGGGRDTFYLPSVAPGVPTHHEVCGCIVARGNSNLDKFTGLFFEASPSLFANFGQNNCMHAAAPCAPTVGPLQHNAVHSARGRIMLHEPTLTAICEKAQVA